jgi:translation initiation factor 4E
VLRPAQLLACIGEQFSEGEEVCGVVVNMRQRQDKVCLWTKTASNEAVQVNVGKQFKEFLEYDQNCGFLAHVRPCHPAKSIAVPRAAPQACH